MATPEEKLKAIIEEKTKEHLTMLKEMNDELVRLFMLAKKYEDNNKKLKILLAKAYAEIISLKKSYDGDIDEGTPPDL